MLREVGLVGVGEAGIMGETGARTGVNDRGDLSERLGRLDVAADDVEMVKANLGFATLEASMLSGCCLNGRL